MKTSSSKISVFQNAVALGLLLAVANATALAKAAPVGTNNTPTGHALGPGAKAATNNNNLTPAVTVSGPASPSPDDIRDIRQPRHFPTPWLWVVIAVGVATLGAAAQAAWRWLQHGKYFDMVPSEIALQRLEEARRLMDPDEARDYCYAASKIIRSYLEDQLHLHAPRLTTEEFLRQLVEGSESIAAPHRALLGGFLQHCDLAKFAGWRYSLPALAEMHASAIYFVWQSSRVPATATKTHKPPVPTPAPAPVPSPAPENNLANKV